MKPYEALELQAKALSRAWSLGQTYWQQADSNSYSQNKKSDETQEKFNVLVDAVRLAVALNKGGTKK